MLRIGIDFDEVLVNHLDSIIEYYNNKYSTNYSFNDFHSYHFCEVWGGTREDAIKEIFDFYNTSYFKEQKIIEESKLVLNKFKELGFDLFVITGRPNSISEDTITKINDNFKDFFKDILFTNNFSIEGIELKKSDFVNNLQLDYFIEDSIPYSKDILENTNVKKLFLFNNPWNINETISDSRLIRVDSWKEILESFNQLLKEK